MRVLPSTYMALYLILKYPSGMFNYYLTRLKGCVKFYTSGTEQIVHSKSGILMNNIMVQMLWSEESQHDKNIWSGHISPYHEIFELDSQSGCNYSDLYFGTSVSPFVFI